MPLPRPLTQSALACALALAGSPDAAAQALTVTDGLQLWMKADAGIITDGNGNVTNWTDQSSNAHVAFAVDEVSTPALIAAALNGKPVLRFDGVDDRLHIADAESLSIVGDLTTFFVVKFDDFVTYRAVWAKTAGPGGNLPAPTDFYTLPGSGIPQVYRGDGAGSIAPFPSTVPLRVGEYLTVGFSLEGTTCTHFIGAQPASSGPLDVLAADAETELIIGSRTDLFTKMKGDIAEIVIYDRALPPAEIASVAGYLEQKYNIVNLPPVAGLTVTPAGPTLNPGEVVTLTATTTDPDGTIARVQFFVNGAPFATAVAPPYTAKLKLESGGAYHFSVRAIDNKDVPGDSAPVTRTVTPAGGTPVLDVTTSLQLWLKADAGTTTNGEGNVIAWADQSPNAHSADSPDDFSAPALVPSVVNGQPVLRFDGVDDYLIVPDSESLSFTGDLTTFFVLRIDDFVGYRTVWTKTAGPGGNLPAPTDYYTVPGSGLPQVLRGDGAAALGTLTSTTPLTVGEFLTAGFQIAGTTATHFKGGQATATGTIDVIEADADTALLIGTRTDLFTRMFGDIAEIVIYDRALTSDELSKVQSYLGSRYALPIGTPVNDPPTAAITAPAQGASFVAPADVPVEATANDPDGSIQRVEFLVNGTVAATDFSAPFSAVLTFPVAAAATLVVRPIDNLGKAGTSTPVAITVTANEPIPLPSPATLMLWLRADKGVEATAGAVSAWNDQSGNFGNALQTQANRQPLLVADAINSLPALRFDGLDDSLSAASSPALAITGDLTTFFVARFDDFTTYQTVWAKTQGNLPAPTDFYLLPNSGTPRAYRGNGAASAAFVDALQPPIPGETVIMAFDMAGTTLHHYLNGASNGTGELPATLGDTGAPLWIGTRGDQFTRMKGDIAEIVIYNTALSTDDRAAVFDYLGARYGIAITPPEPTPVLSIVRDGPTAVTISWPIEVFGWTLTSSDSMIDGTWFPVPGVSDNSVTESILGLRFYRLEQDAIAAAQ